MDLMYTSEQLKNIVTEKTKEDITSSEYSIAKLIRDYLEFTDLPESKIISIYRAWRVCEEDLRSHFSKPPSDK